MRFFVSILSFHEYGGISTKLDLRFSLQFAPATHRIAKSIRKTSSSSRPTHLEPPSYPRSQQNFKKRAARICERPAFGLRGHAKHTRP